MVSPVTCHYNKYKWRNGSGGRAAGLIYTCQARGHGFVSHKFRIVWIIIPACLIKGGGGGGGGLIDFCLGPLFLTY